MLKLMYNGYTVTCGGGFVSFPDPAHFVTLIQNTGGGIARASTATYIANGTSGTWTAKGIAP